MKHDWLAFRVSPAQISNYRLATNRKGEDWVVYTLYAAMEADKEFGCLSKNNPTTPPRWLDAHPDFVLDEFCKRARKFKTRFEEHARNIGIPFDEWARVKLDFAASKVLVEQYFEIPLDEKSARVVA